MEKHILAAALSVLWLAAQPSFAADVVRLALPSTDDIDRAVAFAAEDRRFFAESGITAEVTLYRGAGAGQEALAAGAADMTVIVAPGAAIAVSRGVKEKVVAAGPIIGNEGWRILVLDNAPIKTPADLAGKKLGISSKGSTTDFYAIWLGDKFKVKFQSVPLGGGGVQALKAQQIDAVVVAPILAYKLLAQGGYRSLIDFGEFKDLYLPGVIAVSTDYLDKNPTAVRGFVKAFFQGARYLRDNEAYSISVLKQFVGEEDHAFLKPIHDNVIRNIGTDGLYGAAALEASVALAKLAGVINVPSAASFTLPGVIRK